MFLIPFLIWDKWKFDPNSDKQQDNEPQDRM